MSRNNGSSVNLYFFLSLLGSTLFSPPITPETLWVFPQREHWNSHCESNCFYPHMAGSTRHTSNRHNRGFKLTFGYNFRIKLLQMDFFFVHLLFFKMVVYILHLHPHSYIVPFIHHERQTTKSNVPKKLDKCSFTYVHRHSPCLCTYYSYILVLTLFRSDFTNGKLPNQTYQKS
jgi:hypothetical protein